MTRRALLLTLAVTTSLAGLPATAQQVLPPGRIDASGNLILGPVTLGKRQSGKFVITPDTLQIQGPGSTGPVGGMSVTPGLPNAGARSLAAWFGDVVNVGAYCTDTTGATDSTACVQQAASDADARGLPLVFPPGIFASSTGFVLGDGSNTAPSTKHHRIRVRGAGRGGSPSLSSVQQAAPTILRYTGPASATAAVLTLAGPLHSIGVADIDLDANGAAGIGLLTVHVTDFQYERVVARNYTKASYRFTTRTGFPSGAAYGTANGLVLNCFAYDPASSTADAIQMTSGVASSTTLAGNPDTANVKVIGGVFFYGGAAGSAGMRLAGADNNMLTGFQVLPANGNTGGKSVVFEQWPGSPSFPKENVFTNIGMTQDVGGVSGTGYNTFLVFQEDDGAALPTLDYINTVSHKGTQLVDGKRVYRSTPLPSVSTQTDTYTTSSSWSDIPGMGATVTPKQAAKARVSFNVLAAKFGSGSGDVVLTLNGAQYGPTISRIVNAADYATTGSSIVFDVPAGTSTIKVQYRSNDTNQFHVASAVLNVELLQ